MLEALRAAEVVEAEAAAPQLAIARIPGIDTRRCGERFGASGNCEECFSQVV